MFACAKRQNALQKCKWHFVTYNVSSKYLVVTYYAAYKLVACVALLAQVQPSARVWTTVKCNLPAVSLHANKAHSFFAFELALCIACLCLGYLQFTCKQAHLKFSQQSGKLEAGSVCYEITIFCSWKEKKSFKIISENI